MSIHARIDEAAASQGDRDDFWRVVRDAPTDVPGILDREPTKVYVVSEYATDRCYGGPEEGGWWYDWDVFVKAREVYTDEATAYADCRAMNAAQRELDRDTGKRDRYSVIGEPDTVFMVESVPGENASTERPHYE